MAKKQRVIHFTEMQKFLDLAYQRRQLVTIRAWRDDGHTVIYKGWLIHHQYWRGGYMRLKNPINGELRTLPEIYIREINGMKVYL